MATKHPTKTGQAWNEHKVLAVYPKDIISNLLNHREPCPKLAEHGYGSFKRIPGSGKPSLYELMTATNPDGSPNTDLQGEFLRLISEFEGEQVEDADGDMKEVRKGLVALAADLDFNDFIQPIRVRKHPTVEGKFDLVVGARRFLAHCYRCLKKAQDYSAAPLPAIYESEGANETDLRYKALSENLHRLNMGPLEQARTFAELAALGMSVDAIASKAGVNSQKVRQRMKLLQLSDEDQQRVERGELGVVAAVKKVIGKDESTNPLKPQKQVKGERRRVPTLKDLEDDYDNNPKLDQMNARQYIASVLDIKYLPYEQHRKVKEEEASKPKAKRGRKPMAKA